MKHLYLLLVFIFFYPETYAQTNWVKIWSDEFNYTGLPDPGKWNYDVGGTGWGNEELQYYTSERTENARVEDGSLIIEARKEDYEDNEYTSARLKTLALGDWKYGKVEVKAKIPEGRGIWSAIWLLPSENVYGNWPNSGEIDIMEHVGFQPDKIHGTIHTENYNHEIGTQIGSEIEVRDPFDEFHNYGLEWYPDSLVFLFDDTTYLTVRKESENPADWPFDQNFHLILNIAVGGTWGGSQGIDPSIFPQQMLVDYVRVYKNIPEQENYDFTLWNAAGGEVSSDSANGSYAKGTQIEVFAEPNEDYEFIAWTGDLQSTENPFAFNLNLDVQLTPIFRKKNEVLKNPEFSTGFMHWVEYNNTNGSNYVEEQQACFELTEEATNPWDVQLSQGNIKFEEGATYMLSFFASSNSTGTLNFSAGMNQDPWSTYQSDNITLSEDMQYISREFTIEQLKSQNGRVSFDLGNMAGKTCIDNVSLQLIEAAPVQAVEEETIPIFKIYPTSIDTITTIVAESPIRDIDVLEENGSKVNKNRYSVEKVSGNIARIQWSNDIKTGVYLIKTETETGIHIKKLLKE